MIAGALANMIAQMERDGQQSSTVMLRNALVALESNKSARIMRAGRKGGPTRMLKS